MGTMSERLLYVLPGWGACAVALLFGDPIPYAATAALLFTLATPLPAVPRTIALLLAPLALASGAGVTSLATLTALLWLALALAACAPLYLFLGGRLPLVGAALWLPLSLLLLTPLLFIRIAPSFFTSDIATRAQLAFLGAACLLLSAILPLVRLPGRQAQATKETYVPLFADDRKTQAHAEEE